MDLSPNLSDLGFEDNGELSISVGNVMELTTNENQPSTSVDDGGANTYSEIVTLVEDGPNSGIFESFDSNDQSIMKILDDAPRGQSAQITYNKDSVSVVVGSFTASVAFETPVLSIGNGESLNPGTEYPVTLVDPDQNINSGVRDDLDVFRDSALIPSITIGNPITLETSQNVQFHSTSPTLVGGDTANFSVPDLNSDRLEIDTSTVSDGSYEMISVNLGISASSLSSTLIDVSESNTDGTNWINYDLRSFENDYEISDFNDTTFTLYFGTLGNSPIQIIDAGDISSSQGFIQIDDADVDDISDESGNVFLVIDFDSSSNDIGVLTISSETEEQPIVIDFFSFGLENDESINNSIYRFELEETSDNSSTFDGTFEYAVTNQLNILDPNFIKTIQTIDNEVKIVVTDRLIDDEGISISYSDLDEVGVTTTTSSKTDITTHSGIVSASSNTFRFGQPVTIILNDSDLNLKSDRVDIYSVINDPNSPNVDTVGKDGNVLLEIKLKDIRYQRCTIDGVEFGGLGATGFTLVETGPDTGIFEGVFKMPSQICNESGTELISTAGGSLDAKYYDSRDVFGKPNVFSLLRNKSTFSYQTTPHLSSYDLVKPLSGNVEEIILSGSVKNHKRGIPLEVQITFPDGKSQTFGATLSNGGNYRSVISINESSLSGIYKIVLSHNNYYVGSISFVVTSPDIPDWIKNNAGWWADQTISDSEFVGGIEFLIDEGLISVSSSPSSIIEPEIPEWIKNTARWWSENQISDEEFMKSIQYLVNKGIIRV